MTIPTIREEKEPFCALQPKDGQAGLKQDAALVAAGETIQAHRRFRVAATAFFLKTQKNKPLG